ncbi:MAG: T9SS type A sorting domain-containing protein [Patescibacteria group bacterium]
MHKKWLWIPIVAVLALVGTPLTPPPAEAGVRITQELPVVTKMAGIGMAIDQQIEGDILVLTVKPEDTDILNIGLGLMFNPSEYEIADVTPGYIIMDNKEKLGEIGIGSLFNKTIGYGPLVVSLRKKTDVWGEINLGGLWTFTANRETRQYDPVSTLTPAKSIQSMPGVLSLDNYPNPFNPETEIRYSLPADGVVRLTVYNMVGQEVRTLVDEQAVAGEHSIKWNATDNMGQPVAGGVYFYKLTTPNRELIQKMLLLK